MNKIAKRLVAGVSAAALLVSAVGVDRLADLFMKTSYADAGVDRGKTARSTGFDNLEQDTNGIYYNTGYGLHTNKTASEVNDGTGRTFDVDLESWYVGENPVDVATILDASGSMAWTVDTLEPLVIDYKCFDDYEKANGVKIEKLADLQEIQEEHNGYLPQDIVDCILNPTKTDNSKLSYADYMYYVYEKRSSVSEFVPLGYWDGGAEPLYDSSLIGYYPFDGTLENKAPNADADTDGKMIAMPESGKEINTDTLMVEAEPTFDSKNCLDVKQTAQNGGILLDNISITDGEFSIQMEILGGDKNSTDNSIKTPIMCLTDGVDYYQIFRPGNTAANRLRIRDKNDKSILDANAVFSEKQFNTFTFTFKFEGKTLTELKVTTKNAVNLDSAINPNEKEIEYTKTFSAGDVSELDISKLKIIVAGSMTEVSETCSEAFVKNVVIKNSSDIVIANYPLTSDLSNSVEGGNVATFVKQAYKNEGKFEKTAKADSYEVDPEYHDNSLDLNKTAKKGAVLLGAMSQLDSQSSFTLSMKLQKTGKCDTEKRNIFYLGSKDQEDYLQFFRSNKIGGDLILSKDQDDEEKSESLYYQGGLIDNNVWYTNTLVFVPVGGGYKVTPYVNGKPAEMINGTLCFPNGTEGGSVKTGSYHVPDSITLSAEDVVLLLGALSSSSTTSEHYIDDVYIFDNALDEEHIKAYFSAASCAGGEKSTHAQSIIDGKLVDIAQISQDDDRVGKNTNIEERRGWYYVNSQSNWADVTSCLLGGKQYLGVMNDEFLGITPDSGEDLPKGKAADKFGDKLPEEGNTDNKNVATVPSSWAAAHEACEKAESSETKPTEEQSKYNEYYKKLVEGNTDDEFKAPNCERSLQFYVDSVGYLRCFYTTGEISWKSSKKKVDGVDTTFWNYDPRTFCSVVYTNAGTAPEEPTGDDLVAKMQKQENELKTIKDSEGNTTYRASITKYEKLNVALNLFYEQLAKNSDLTNTAVVRFSTNNAIGADETATNTNLQKLIMQKWTNWSTNVQEYRNDNPGEDDPQKNTFLQGLLIPTEGETAADEVGGQYPYVMTGGTYTWTGLKAFYDNMVKTDGGDQNKDIATDGRDKYLIIFTDGRDNAIEQTNESTSSHTDSTGQAPTGKTVKTNSELAEAWADKLKEEGYTIYCVMMATGSISPDTNKDEYDKAKAFLKTLAGDADTEPTSADIDNYVIITKPTSDNLEETAVGAFQQILADIQQPRDDYTVQDYIDPRFDLIGKAYVDGVETEVIYHLGANGEVTLTDTNNNKLETITVKDRNGTDVTISNSDKAGNIIDRPSDTGLAYTPRDSYMVNRKSTTDIIKYPKGYDNGDGVGTGYLYYDDVKDMYYLRWTKQVIPMEDEAFNTDTTQASPKYLDVWSATIRLKAKDDFIGGNNILTNGNEAGENLVFSTKTLELMKNNWAEYKSYAGDYSELPDTYSERAALQTLSGYNRKINAIDANGVSQAVYGDGINVPSCGFPRVTVDVRLLPINTKPLNDVIYMGEVVSPTMMLADIEDGYMSGSYYLQYLERYAYRLYGNTADQTPLIDLLNEWLKINDKETESKTFTVPYIYLPDPVYNKDGKLDTDSDRVKIENSTGATWKDDKIDFTDLNLRDVTGFITYTWSRDTANLEEQQKTKNSDGESINDITIDYVVKNTKQIKYNLQLKFTPLQEEAITDPDVLKDANFIVDTLDASKSDSFFKVDTTKGDTYYEFIDEEAGEKLDTWTFTNRSEYLKAMVSETHTFKPVVAYDSGKWNFVGNITLPGGGEIIGMEEAEALKYYTDLDKEQISSDASNKLITDKGAYDWDTGYKPVVGNTQIEEDYKYGNAVLSTDGYSLEANTTYTKDVVNAALALELFIDGKYLTSDLLTQINSGKSYTFEATRYYVDPIDPPPYTTTEIGANANGIKYQLKFKVDPTSLPKEPIQENTIYQVWAKLEEVRVYDSGSSAYKSIKDDGYTDVNALPIGTYEIKTSSDTADNNSLENGQFQIGTDVLSGATVNFKYLKIDNDPRSYTYDRFPDSVYTVSADAAKDTKDGEYQIWNETTDYSKKNIAESNRERKTEGADSTYTLTFNFGTVDTESSKGAKGESVKDYLKEHPEATSAAEFTNDYAKDRLGIIMLSADNNSLAITKEITNYKTSADLNQDWTFTVTIKTDDEDWINDHHDIKYDLFERDSTSAPWVKESEEKSADIQPGNPVRGEDGLYTLTVKIELKHNQKALLKDLPDGDWQVTEVEQSGVLYTPHNNANGLDEDEWHYQRSAATNVNTLTPISQVDFENEFPYELPSAGGSGTLRFVLFGTLLTALGAMLFAVLYFDRRKKARK